MAVTVDTSDVIDYSASFANKKASGKVTAFYYGFLKANKFSLSVGEGEPSKELKLTYDTKTQASMVATAELNKRKRKEATVNLTMTSTPTCVAGGDGAPVRFQDIN